MLVVTYSSDHNHPWPPSRNHARPTKKPEPVPDPVQPEPEEKFADLGGDDSMITTAEELGWLGEMETTSSTVLESPIMATGYHADVALIPMREEDESLFADLGELPECSVVFRQGLLTERRRYTAPWCGTTSWGQKSQQKKKKEEKLEVPVWHVLRAAQEKKIAALFFKIKNINLCYFSLLRVENGKEKIGKVGLGMKKNKWKFGGRSERICVCWEVVVISVTLNSLHNKIFYWTPPLFLSLSLVSRTTY